mmetsp:Transcript_24831/g.79983  ORF Transcript_24831/g.79983 Transcript_24831/m.79983 type:complete len:381 (+) Transcript_24831:381-1523(+)
MPAEAGTSDQLTRPCPAAVYTSSASPCKPERMVHPLAVRLAPPRVTLPTRPLTQLGTPSLTPARLSMPSDSERMDSVTPAPLRAPRSSACALTGTSNVCASQPCVASYASACRCPSTNTVTADACELTSVRFTVPLAAPAPSVAPPSTPARSLAPMCVWYSIHTLSYSVTLTCSSGTCACTTAPTVEVGSPYGRSDALSRSRPAARAAGVASMTMLSVQLCHRIGSCDSGLVTRLAGAGGTSDVLYATASVLPSSTRTEDGARVKLTPLYCVSSVPSANEDSRNTTGVGPAVYSKASSHVLFWKRPAVAFQLGSGTPRPICAGLCISDGATRASRTCRRLRCVRLGSFGSPSALKLTSLAYQVVSALPGLAPKWLPPTYM